MLKNLHSILIDKGINFHPDLPNPCINNIIFDSRLIEKGSLFIGLKGEKVDGGIYWKDAIQKGAVAAGISTSSAKLIPPSLDDTVFILPDPPSQWAGEIVSAFWDNPSEKIDLIGVTGTNGKTTITFLIEYLSRCLSVKSALFGTLINRWPSHSEVACHTTGFADSLQSNLFKAVSAGARIGAIEVSSHALSQRRVSGCKFKCSIFSNLTQDHLDFHSSMEEYYEAKSLLFRSPLFNMGTAKAVINIDNSWGLKLSQTLGRNCWRSSLIDKHAELFINGIKIHERGVKGHLYSPVGEGEFISPLIGDFNLMNLLQAVGALLQQNFPLPELLKALETFPGVPGRMERIYVNDNKNNNFLPKVFVDYAHTPDGLKNALLAARSFTKGSLFCVFGCGGDRDKTKRKQMGDISSQIADKLFITSDNPRSEEPKEILEEIASGVQNKKLLFKEINRSLAIEMAISQASSKDVVLIAGKGHEDYQIIGDEKIYFDDRDEAKIQLNKKLNSI